MTRPGRYPGAIAGAIAAAIAMLAVAYAIVQATRLDMAPERSPRQALHEGRHAEARQLARAELRTSPGQGEAFAVLAMAAAESGSGDAPALLEVAARRARRDRDVHAAAAATAFRAGHLTKAMSELDALLRVGPRNGGELYMAIARHADDPAFASALADTLAEQPPPRWRQHFLANLAARGDAAAVDQVLGGLQQRGELSREETRRWLDRMMRDGRWGDAYAHWIGTLPSLAQGIQAVHNGDFESPVTDLGFDWRRERAQGVFTEVVDDPAGNGRVAHVHFIGRPSAQGDLAHPLLLAPGEYRMAMRVRTEYLRADTGLEWVLRCTDRKLPPIARLGPLSGSAGWQPRETRFVVPATGCEGQWLRLENPAPKGMAQQVSGDLWVDDVTISGVADAAR